MDSAVFQVEVPGHKVFTFEDKERNASTWVQKINVTVQSTRLTASRIVDKRGPWKP